MVIAEDTKEAVQIGPAMAAMPVPNGRMTQADRYFDVELPLHEAIDRAIAQHFPHHKIIKVEYGKIRWRYKYPFSFREPPDEETKQLLAAAKEGGMKWAYLKSSVWACPPTDSAQE